MRIKIIYPNSKGKIELTKEELEKLLNESYSEGYSDGCSRYSSISIPSSPYITYCNGNSADSALRADKVKVNGDNCDGLVTYAASMVDDIGLTSTSKSNWAAAQTETIEICNVNGIGVMKTNEI
jgi:hypothetical protein